MAVYSKTIRRGRVKRASARRRNQRDNPFGLPAATVIHTQALRMLHNTDRAVTRLARTSDTEALHDARVALRRLRSWLRDFEDILPLKRKQRRQLQKLAHASNPGRDLEVCLAWLDTALAGMDPRALASARQLATQLTRLRAKSQAQLLRRVPAEWQRLSPKLKHALADNKRTRDGGFLQAYLAALARDVEAYTKAYTAVRLDPAPAKIHVLRIAAKRVRYVVEVILPWQTRAAPLVRMLRELQDRAGEVQDLQRLTEFFEAAFRNKLHAQYQKLLNAYADPDVHEYLLPQAARVQFLGSWLWLARVLGQARAECSQRFRKNCLVPGRQTSVPVMKTLLAALRQERPRLPASRTHSRNKS